ncbi:MAG TPA: hypothetical protein VIL48_18315 [Acidimicrobiales bacterium]
MAGPPPAAPPTPGRRRPWPWVVAGAALVVVVVVIAAAVGLSDGDGGETTTDRTATTASPGAGTETTQPVASGPPAAPAGVPEPVVEYFEAFAADDLAYMQAVLDHAAEGSPAALYATHQIAVTRALGPDGVPTTVDVDDDTIVLRATATDPSGQEVELSATFGDFEMDGDRLSTFTVDGVPLADRIRVGDPAGVSGNGVTVRIVTAYVTPRGDLWLNVDIANTRGDVVEVADYDWALVTPDGRQVDPSENVCCPTAPSVGPGATAGHVVAFEQVGLGGTFQFVAFSEDFMTEIRLEVPVPG